MVSNTRRRILKVKSEKEVQSKSNAEPGIDKYFRVGDDYFTIHEKMQYLEPRRRQTLLDDFGREGLRSIAKYKGFTNVPDNYNYQRVIGGYYNLCEPFTHKPAPGDWIYTERLIRQIFGDQYEAGLDYVQLLLQNPKHILPVLVLVSLENKTGKTTFITYLANLFYGNVRDISSSEFEGGFNSHFITKLLITIDESSFDVAKATPRIKALATATTATINAKYVAQRLFPIYPKIILAANDIHYPIRVKKYDVRYWFKRLKPHKFGHVENLDQILKKEIPYFLDFLNKRSLYFRQPQSRHWFPDDYINTPETQDAKKHNRSQMLDEFVECCERIFETQPAIKQFIISAIDVKESLLFFGGDDNKKMYAFGDFQNSKKINRDIEMELGIEPQARRRWNDPILKFSGNNKHFIILKKVIENDVGGKIGADAETIPF